MEQPLFPSHVVLYLTGSICYFYSHVQFVKSSEGVEESHAAQQHLSVRSILLQMLYLMYNVERLLNKLKAIISFKRSLSAV